jgi:hypothetical protein
VNRLGIESCVGLRLQSPDEIAADKRDVLPDTAMAALTPIHVHGDLHRRESVALLARSLHRAGRTRPLRACISSDICCDGSVPCQVVTDVPR